MRYPSPRHRVFEPHNPRPSTPPLPPEPHRSGLRHRCRRQHHRLSPHSQTPHRSRTRADAPRAPRPHRTHHRRQHHRDPLASRPHIRTDHPTPEARSPEAHTDTPAVLLYRYQIAGVTYECAQDVSPLPNLVRQLRVDLPIQVRFDPRNPGNSIVVAEAWNGLRFQHPSGQHAIAQPQPEKIDPTPANAPPQSKSLSHHG